MRACAASDDAICSNRKIVPFPGDIPNTRNGARLRSSSPIMAPVNSKKQRNLQIIHLSVPNIVTVQMFVTSRNSYCSPLWDTCGKLLKDKLQRFQSRAARVLTGANRPFRNSSGNRGELGRVSNFN